MRKRRPVAIVVDASVARASHEPAEPRSKAYACGSALRAIQACSLLAWSSELRWEWLEKPIHGLSGRQGHASAFARRWLREMQRKRLVRSVVPMRCEEVREAAWRRLSENGYHAVEKDMHLVEAALASDNRVLSLDDAVRGLLETLGAPALRRLLWANPLEGACADWLREGAPTARRFRLPATRTA